MPETSFAVTYWHIDSETDMTPVVKELLPHGYYGTITGTMQEHLAVEGEDTPAPTEKWVLSLVGGGHVLPVHVGDTVVWNGIAAQVMSRADFDAKVNPA